ncbi:acyl-CoA dehydrogenase [Parendozoicomonas haliclonae]|uniref:Acyl-coenzyme A dehydrogenase n=1 Tax=Parendozoicomonas haliclonae TaxID=1960125 RepID=A0A1X7AMC4_9GAMM|nr:acyl-CoA dehydrogenase [Parendozoicomonas haliclonae]SMA49403.1 Acyl-coenzyme A dehydrogenase [Parendozoicomonas haliclonae]
MLAWILLQIAALVALAYKRADLMTSAITFGVITLAIWLIGPGGVAAFSALVLTAVFAVLAQTKFRANTLTNPIFKIYKKLLPEMSETEQTALDAGTVWWDGQMFAGKPDWDKLTNHPNPTMSEEEQAFLDNQVETLASMIDEWTIEQDGDMPPEVWDYMKKERFFAMIIPKEYGGLGFSAQAQSAVLQKLAGLSGAAFTTVGVPNSLGPGELLLKYGTEDQKNHYLPRLADGREIPCFALTGPRAGSDATSLPDTGIVCKGEYEGKEVVGIRMNFSKRYITLAPVATVVGMAFRMFDPDGLLGDKNDIGITVALLPRGLKGMEIGNRHKPLGTPFMNGPIHGHDVFIPLEFIIGGPDMRGHGWKMLVECLSVGRCITLPSSGAGGGRYAIAAGGAYSRIRRQFNVPIAKLEGVQDALARIAGNTYTAAAGARVTAIAIDQGEKPAVPSAILKYNLTEMARQIALDSMDIHGGKAIITGPGNYLSSGYASVPVAITVEGANILTRSMITFGQGAIRCHPYVLPEMHAAKENDLPAFDKALFGHFGFIASNAARSLVLGLTNSAFSGSPVSDATGPHYKQINRYVAAFSLTVDMCMFSLGGQLKFKEMISGRLADMLSKLYLASCVLKHWQDQGRHREDLPLVDYSCQKLFAEFEEALDGVLSNLPNRPVAWALRGLTLPLGRRMKKPGDTLINRIVDLVSSKSATRERLIGNIYRADTRKAATRNPLAVYDTLLDRVERADPIYKKISQALKDGKYNEAELTIEGRITEGVALGVLTQEEGDFMLAFEKDVLDMVNVDDFPLEHFGPVSENQDKKVAPQKKRRTRKVEDNAAA